MTHRAPTAPTARTAAGRRALDREQPMRFAGRPAEAPERPRGRYAEVAGRALTAGQYVQQDGAWYRLGGKFGTGLTADHWAATDAAGAEHTLSITRATLVPAFLPR